MVVDAGSGLLDETTPWLPARPEWLHDEPGARQCLDAGAALVTFSGDKLLGGPQAGVIVGRRDLVDRCKAHPLARAVRADKATLAGMQQVALRTSTGDVASIPFWRMATTPLDELRAHAEAIARAITSAKVVDTEAVAGAGSLPGLDIPSVGVAIEASGPQRIASRLRLEGVVARVEDGRVVCDLRTVDPDRRRPTRRRAPRRARLGEAEPMRVVATAGHVDHGKSTLVLALTGTDPDRFAEEKARGLTIDLGFAFTTLPSGIDVGFVDVPGHVRFVKNMLAGVGAVEIALLVVAANEGWMPQTEEHVAILELLDIRPGLVAVTKADLVDAETLELAAAGAGRPPRRDHAWRAGPSSRSTASAGADSTSCGPCSTRCWRSAPDATRHRAPARVDRPGLLRGGSGTVVTGTLTGGALSVDQEVVVEPGTRAARVRRIESHGAHLERVGPGNRVALNLAGVEHDAVRRGRRRRASRAMGYAHDGRRASCGPRPDHEFPRRGPVDAHVGSGEHERHAPPHRRRCTRPEAPFGRLQLPVGLPLAPGDRLVLRSSARRATTGGAEVLDVAPTRRISDAPGRLALPLPERVLAARPWATAAELGPLAGVADGDGMGARRCAPRAGPRTSAAGS